MGLSYEEAKTQLASSGKPGKLIILPDGSWDVMALPDKDPVLETRRQQKEFAKAQAELERKRLEQEAQWRAKARRASLLEQEKLQELHQTREAERLQLIKEQEKLRIETLNNIRTQRLREASDFLLKTRSQNAPQTDFPSAQGLATFSADYRAAIERSLIEFVENGHDVACIGVYTYEYGHCQLCGHSPIKWHYILENLSNHNTLCVGSECIQNYKTILQEWGYRPAYIVFPECLKKFARWILDQDRHAIEFSDAVACFFTKNPLGFYHDLQPRTKLQMFIYAKHLHGSLVAGNAIEEDVPF